MNDWSRKTRTVQTLIERHSGTMTCSSDGQWSEAREVNESDACLNLESAFSKFICGRDVYFVAFFAAHVYTTCILQEDLNA